MITIEHLFTMIFNEGIKCGIDLAQAYPDKVAAESWDDDEIQGFLQGAKLLSRRDVLKKIAKEVVEAV